MAGIADILMRGVSPDRAGVICILVHGRGQTPEEMEAGIIARLSAPDVAFALPRATGKSWYSAKAVDPQTDATRAELGQSRADLDRALSDMRSHGRPVVVAGFSQGACLAIEQAFGTGPSPDAVVALTGCRVGVTGDDRPAALTPGLPVYLTGSDADPWIPAPAFAAAAGELALAGARLRADAFPGRPHEVSAPEIAMFDAILSDLAAGRPPRMEAPR